MGSEQFGCFLPVSRAFHLRPTFTWKSGMADWKGYRFVEHVAGEPFVLLRRKNRSRIGLCKEIKFFAFL
jgi:hypothetical protein